MNTASSASLLRALNSTGIDQSHNAMRQLVERLCNQNSGTGNLEGLAVVQSMLADEYDQLGGKMAFVDVDPQVSVDDLGNEISRPLGQAIHIIKRPETRPRALLCIHMDTVYSVDHPFQKCKMLDDNTMNGPGVADAKGGLVVMLNALKAFEQTEYAKRLGWEVIINPDEEIGSVGSEKFLKERAALADVGLLFEPALPDGTLVSWRKGTGNFSFVFRGTSAHSGREFEKGRNAIVACCRMMDDISKLNTDPDTTYNVGRISGGGALNIVPDLAIGRVNIRVKSLDHQLVAEQKLQALVDRYNSLDGTLQGISCTQYGTFTSPPKPMTPQIEALQKRIEDCGKALQIPINWRGTGGASDGNKFAAAGLANIDTLGPRGGDIHSPTEYLLIDSLVPRAKLVTLILMSLAAEA